MSSEPTGTGFFCFRSPKRRRKKDRPLTLTRWRSRYERDYLCISSSFRHGRTRPCLGVSLRLPGNSRKIPICPELSRKTRFPSRFSGGAVRTRCRYRFSRRSERGNVRSLPGCPPGFLGAPCLRFRQRHSSGSRDQYHADEATGSVEEGGRSIFLPKIGFRSSRPFRRFATCRVLSPPRRRFSTEPRAG